MRGRDLVSGLPKELTLTGGFVRDALSEPVAAIVGAVKATLEETPPELASDIVNDGMLLAGGGCLLHEASPERLHEETGMPTRLAEDPLSTVAEGAGKASTRSSCWPTPAGSGAAGWRSGGGRRPEGSSGGRPGKPRRMPRPNQLIVNPITGERIVFRRTTRETDGECLLFDVEHCGPAG